MCITAVTATVEYPTIGGSNHTYELEPGIFGLTGTTPSIVQRAIANPQLSPLMADLDNDNDQELVVLDGSIFRVYSGSTLTLENTYSSNIVGSPSMILYDIDGDGYTEIIASSTTNKNIDIIEWNGTHMYLQNNFTLTDWSFLDGETMIACRDTEECIIIYAKLNARGNFGNNNQSLYGRVFNSTNLYDAGAISPSASQYGYCRPLLPYISVNDYDQDSTDEYIFSYLRHASTTSAIIIEVLDINSSNQPLQELEIVETNNYQNPPGETCTTHAHARVLTSPTVFNVDGGGSDPEIIIGYQVDDDEFEMMAYYSNGDRVRNLGYPNLLLADGEIISNIIIMDAFESGQNTDFCVLGYDKTGEQLNLLCASELNPPLLGIQSDEYLFDIDDSTYSNLTQTLEWHNALAHSSNQDFDAQNELINHLGVFDLDAGFVTFGSTLDIIYTNPHQDSAVVMLDLESVGKTDMIILDSSYLYYINDQFINTEAQITSISSNPCIKDVWKVNTSVQVTVIVDDINDDNVGATATLYDNYPIAGVPQVKPWSINYSSPHTFTFNFVANRTITSGELFIGGRDNVDDGNETQTHEFNVATNGLEFGDSSCEFYKAELVPGVGATTTTLEGATNTDDNAILTFMNDQSIAGLGLGNTVIWLIIMLVTALGIWMGNPSSASHPNISIGLIFIAEIMLLIIGAYLEFLDLGVLIAMVVIGLGVIAMSLRKFFTGTSS